MRNIPALYLMYFLVAIIFVTTVSLACMKQEEMTSEEAATEETGRAGKEVAAEEAGMSEPMTSDLSELNDSGVSGTVTLTPMENQTKVTINLTGAPEGGVHPAHIHKGTCDNLGAPTYPLNDIRNGTSETTIDATVEAITSEAHAVNVHKSPEELSSYVACGEIQQSGHSH